MSKVLFGMTMILLIFGLVVLSSAGLVEGQKNFGSPYYYLNRQLLLGVLPGLILMFIFRKIDYKFLKKISFLILLGALFMLLAVFAPHLGQGLKGATRWLSIAGFSFQPSEALKLALIVYLAAWFSNRDERTKNWAFGMAPFFVLLIFVAGVLALQPDIGTLIVVTLISISIYFFAGSNLKHLFLIGAVILGIFVLIITVEPYRLNRIKTYLDPSLDPKGISYQLNQSMIAIGSGGMFGVGYGKSTQKFGFLPEVIHDSIFAVVVEELGFIGAAGLIGLFVLFGLMMGYTANSLKDKFGKLLVMGMATWILGQAFLNIAAVSGLAPLTGVPLPFVSYGGTAMMVLLAGMGIVFNVARKA